MLSFLLQVCIIRHLSDLFYAILLMTMPIVSKSSGANNVSFFYAQFVLRVANIYIIYDNIEQLIAVIKIFNIRGIQFFNFLIKR